MLNLLNQFKHEMAKSITHALLAEAGYTLVTCGMERLVREVTSLDHANYRKLKIPTVLKRLPDYLIINLNDNSSQMVDIAYRSNIEERIKYDIKSKVRNVEELIFILFQGGTSKSGSNQDFFEVIRCCRFYNSDQGVMADLSNPPGVAVTPVPLDNIAANQIWDRMLPLNALFPRVRKVEVHLENAVEYATRAFAA